MQFKFGLALVAVVCFSSAGRGDENDADRKAVAQPSPDKVLRGLQRFYERTAREDGSFQNGIDPEYLGMSDSAFSDLAAVTYAVTLHKTFGWQLPHEKQTIAWLLARQQENGDFVNVAGTVDPKSPQGRVYNTTQGLVALHALGVKPKYDPLPVFEEILKQDYKTLPAYSTSFFPLAYLCAGQPIPKQADQAIRALMVPDGDGYLNNHVAATFHSSHYYALVGEPTPLSRQMLARVIRDQSDDGSWLLNAFSRDRHATFDACFVLKHEGRYDPRSSQHALQKVIPWALTCRNDDGGFGHYPGSTSDADAVYFQVGTLVLAGFLNPVDPLPPEPELLSWGHVLPVRKAEEAEPRQYFYEGSVNQVAFSGDGRWLAAATSAGQVEVRPLGKDKGEHWQVKLPLEHLSSVALAHDGRSLVAGSYSQFAFLAEPDNEVQRLQRGKSEQHRGAVTSVAYSPDGKLVATGSIDQTIRLWEVKSGEPGRVLRGHKSWVNSIAFVDEKTLVSGSSDGSVRLWDVASGENTKTIAATKAEVRCVAVSRDGKSIAAGLRYGATKIWDTDQWRVTVIEQQADDVWSVVFSADGRQLITAAGQWNRPTEIQFWPIEAQKAGNNARPESKAAKQPLKTLRHTGEVLSLALSPDGTQLAAGGADGTVSVWKLTK